MALQGLFLSDLKNYIHEHMTLTQHQVGDLAGNAWLASHIDI